MTGITRHQAYFALMDAATLIVFIGLAQVAMDTGVLFQGIRPGFWHELVGWGTLLPLFLIFAGFMRDEYAELCWQRAAATTVRAMVVLPAAIAIIVSRRAPEAAAGIDAVTAIFWGWALLLTVFVLAFQWHRWRKH